MTPNSESQVEVFFSYAHEDEELRNKLEKHLSVLKWNGTIRAWHDRRILPGQEWAGEIDSYLNKAQIILLLVSADFLASDYCYTQEMKRALERHDSGEAHVIPIILRTCDWQSGPLGKLRALPADGKAVTSWSNQDEAFLDIAQGIRIVAEEIKQRGLLSVPLGSDSKKKILTAQAMTSRLRGLPPWKFSLLEISPQGCYLLSFSLIITLLCIIGWLFITSVSGTVVAWLFSTPTFRPTIVSTSTRTVIALLTSTVPPTLPLPPLPTNTPTLTATSTPTNTPTRTPTTTPIPCAFQGKDNFTTLVTLINAEAVAVNDKNVSFIQSIFAPNAIIRDRQYDPRVNPPAPTPIPQRIWNSPIARYPDDLFKNTSIRLAAHTDPMVVGQGITATQAWLVTGSIGEWLDGNTWRQYNNPSKLTSEFGSDHWTFGKNNAGCWVIVQYDFDASHIQFP